MDKCRCESYISESWISVAVIRIYLNRNYVNPFPHTKHLQQTILKRLNKNIEKMSINEVGLMDRVEQIVAKGEIAHYDFHSI